MEKLPSPEKGPRGPEFEPELQHVVAIYISPNKGESMQSRIWVRAIAGVGLEGDRYASRTGSFNTRPNATKEPRIPDDDRQVTVIAEEQIETGNAILKRMGIKPIRANETRRNIHVTLSSDQLNALVGQPFKVGDVLMEGVELCDPCTRPPTLIGRSSDGEAFKKAFDQRGGLRAKIIRGGEIRVNSPIVAL